MELWIQDTPLKSTSLEAIHAMPALLLQKPSKSSKAKDHLQALERRIKLQDEGDIEGLLYEGMTIQQTLRSDKEGMAIAKISLKFKNLMSKGNINGALKLLTDNMHSGILPLNKETLELLIQKHPEPREPSPGILTQGPTRPIHPAACDGMDESVIMKASMLIKGGSGPSGLDADGWRRILTSRAFGAATLDLRKTFAQLIKKLCVEELESPSSLESSAACRLIPLEKKPGLRSIGVGEVLGE